MRNYNKYLTQSFIIESTSKRINLFSFLLKKEFSTTYENNRNLKINQHSSISDSNYNYKSNIQKSTPHMRNKYDYIYGIHTVQAALAFNFRKCLDLFVQMTFKEDTPDHILNIINSAKSKEIKVKYLTRDKMEKFTGGRPHNGLVIKSEPRAYIDASKFTTFRDQYLKKPNGNLLILLDQIVDPQNIGSIIRSAFFLGTDAILLNKINSPPINSSVSKVSSGASECSELFSVSSITNFLSEAIENGWIIVTKTIETENDVQLRVENESQTERQYKSKDLSNEDQYRNTLNGKPKIQTKNTPVSELVIPSNSNVIIILCSKANRTSSNLKGLTHYNTYIPPLLNKNYINRFPYNIVDSTNVGVTAGIIINHLKSQLVAKN